jgi:galactokinase
MNKAQLLDKFLAHYGKHAHGVMYAPGRVNLIGEHTDYNHGFVLPCAIQFKNLIAFRKRDDAQLHVASCNYLGESDQFSVDRDIVEGPLRWANYCRAVIYVLRKRGYKIGGAELMMFGDVPQGGGLSSSAALEVCLGGAMNEMFNLGLTPTQIAEIGQQAENEFMDCQCGIMDQLISAIGKKDHALLIDCADYSSQAVKIPEDLSIVIINSNFKRELVDSEYNDRRADCEEAASVIGVDYLRDATLDQLESNQSNMSNNAFKRARHIISEDIRTRSFIKALEANDFAAARKIMMEAHASIRDDFEIVVEATDTLVNICNDILGEDGVARQTGGGFGGCVVVLCQSNRVDDLLAQFGERYTEASGLVAECWRAEAGPGLHRC